MPARRGKPVLQDAPDAVSVLQADHAAATKLFRAFARARHDRARQQGIAALACELLTIHAHIEEEIVYPVASRVLDRDLVAAATVEHRCAKDLVAELERMRPDDDAFVGTFTVLSAYVSHHIAEEERELLPKLARARGVDLRALTEEILVRKRELEGAAGTGRAGVAQGRR